MVVKDKDVVSETDLDYDFDFNIKVKEITSSKTKIIMNEKELNEFIKRAEVFFVVCHQKYNEKKDFVIKKMKEKIIESNSNVNVYYDELTTLKILKGIENSLIKKEYFIGYIGEVDFYREIYKDLFTKKGIDVITIKID